jgi:formylglycine-generating enzyme required for sulfatase activity
LELPGDESEGETLDLSEFWLADREVSIALFEQFMNEAHPDQRPNDWPKAQTFEGIIEDDHPVQMVSWTDAAMFCNWLSAKEGRQPYFKLTPDNPGRYTVETNEEADGFRFPTKWQWEYACRAGVGTELYFFGDDVNYLADYGVYKENSNSRTARRGSRMCNPWGIFDMHGNVYEWCADSKIVYESERRRPPGNENRKRVQRVHRGGAWLSDPEKSEFLYVSGGPPWYRNRGVGFRVCVPTGRAGP